MAEWQSGKDSPMSVAVRQILAKAREVQAQVHEEAKNQVESMRRIAEIHKEKEEQRG